MHTDPKSAQSPDVTLQGKEGEFRCSASAVRITKLSAQCRIIQVQMWVGLQVHTYSERRSKTVEPECGAKEASLRRIHLTGFIFWSMRVTHCGSPSSMEIIQVRSVHQGSHSVCVNVATYTLTVTAYIRIYCMRVYKKNVRRWSKCTCSVTDLSSTMAVWVCGL